MNISTEQVFIVNSTEIEPHNHLTPEVPLQRNFAMPVAAIHPEDPQSSGICLPQSSLEPSSRSQTCRLCAAVTDMVVPIFEGEGLQNCLADKIHQHLPIQVSEKDVLPVVMCFQCTSTLLAWHELVICSVQADAVMRERLNQQHQPQQPPTAESSQTQFKQEKAQQLPTLIKSILLEYLKSLAMDEEVVLVCQKCDAKLTTSEFSDHLTTKHYLEISYKNSINSFIKDNITFEEQLVSDLELNRDDFELKEVISEYEAKTLPPLFCPYCKSSFSSTTRLIHHLGKHLDVSVEDGVECCGVQYTNKKEFTEHMQTKHIDKSRSLNHPDTVCKSCDFTAENENELKHHVNSCHTEKEKEAKKVKKYSAVNQKYIPAVCPECNKTYSSKYNMLQHLKLHNKTEEHKCNKCGKEYSNKGNLRSHIRVAHEGKMPHACRFCAETFPTKAARDIHARLHTGDRPFNCEICGVAFRAKNTLIRHLDMHLDIRNHKCNICKKAFRKKTHLDAHYRTHKN